MKSLQPSGGIGQPATKRSRPHTNTAAIGYRELRRNMTVPPTLCGSRLTESTSIHPLRDSYEKRATATTPAGYQRSRIPPARVILWFALIARLSKLVAAPANRLVSGRRISRALKNSSSSET